MVNIILYMLNPISDQLDQKINFSFSQDENLKSGKWKSFSSENSLFPSCVCVGGWDHLKEES